MLKSLKGLSIRFFQANKFIAFSSIVSVMLSITLIVTMAVFSGNAKQSLVNEVKKIYGEMDLSVGYNIGQGKIIDESFFKKITSQQNIQQSSGVLITRLIIDNLNADVYTVGVENDALAKSKYHFSKNLSDHDVILNKGLAESMKVQVGDTLSIDHTPLTIKEVLPDLDATGLTPDMVILSRSVVQQHIYQKSGVKNEATYILIKAKENTDILLLAEKIRKIDTDLRIDVAEQNEFLVSNLASLKIFMIVLSTLVLIVTSLLIISNFEVFLYKYKKQFAIMRSIGATTKQMYKVVLLQCSLINIIGSVSGFLLAFVSNQFLQKWFEKLFSFQISTVDFNFKIALVVLIIGMLIIEAFMLIPAYRSTKVLPIKIMRDNEQNDFSHTKIRKIAGKWFLVGSFAFLYIGKIMTNSAGVEVFSVLLAALLLTLGIFIMFPIYLSPVLTKLLPVIKLFSGKASFVAVKNVIPQVKKNTFVILTITTMMMMAVFGSALLKTLEKNDEQYLKQQYPTNIIVTSRLGKNSTINPTDLQGTIKNMTNVKGVSTLSTLGQGELKLSNKNIPFDYVLGDLKAMAEQGLLSVPKEDVKNSIIVTREFAKKNNLQTGDKIEIGVYSEGDQAVKSSGTVIVAIVDKLPGSPLSVFMDWQNTTAKTEFTAFNRAFISSNDEKGTLKQVEVLKQQYPELQINSYDQSLEKSKQMFYQRWAIFIVVMIVILLSVMLGVFNTLINNIQAKRKEFAIMRTLSMDAKGVTQVILTQVMLYNLIGLSLGIVLGGLLTYILSLIDPGPVFFNFTFIGVIVAVMLGMALVIFVPFAKKIAKRAISSELT